MKKSYSEISRPRQKKSVNNAPESQTYTYKNTMNLKYFHVNFSTIMIYARVA